jgi:hypothetical protein
MPSECAPGSSGCRKGCRNGEIELGKCKENEENRATRMPQKTTETGVCHKNDPFSLSEMPQFAESPTP